MRRRTLGVSTRPNLLPATTGCISLGGVQVLLDGRKAVYTPEEVSQILRIGRNKVYDLLTLGEIPCIRLGRAIRIPRQAILRFLGETNDADVHAAL